MNGTRLKGSVRLSEDHSGVDIFDQHNRLIMTVSVRLLEDQPRVYVYTPHWGIFMQPFATNSVMLWNEKVETGS